MQTQTGRILKNGSDLTGPIAIGVDLKGNAWGGTFAVGVDRSFDLYVGCVLQLDDGRCGDVVLYRRDAGVDRSSIIHFRGVGLLTNPAAPQLSRKSG